MEIQNTIQHLKEKLKNKQQQKIDTILPILIQTSPKEIGIYGSFARGDYKATSDVDMYVLYDRNLDKVVKGELYELAQECGIDLLISKVDGFYDTESVFCANIFKDRKIIWGGDSHEAK